MPQLPEQIETALTKIYGPIAGQFTVTETPSGGAPEEIKEQWVGVSLPVRTAHIGRAALAPLTSFDSLTCRVVHNDEPVSITGIDAVHALAEAGKDAAAKFWDEYQLGTLIFRAHEGTLEVQNPDQLS